MAVEAVLVANGAGERYQTGSNADVLVVFDPSDGIDEEEAENAADLVEEEETGGE